MAGAGRAIVCCCLLAVLGDAHASGTGELLADTCTLAINCGCARSFDHSETKETKRGRESAADRGRQAGRQALALAVLHLSFRPVR